MGGLFLLENHSELGWWKEEAKRYVIPSKRFPGRKGYGRPIIPNSELVSFVF